jgi:hypothetical protein
MDHHKGKAEDAEPELVPSKGQPLYKDSGDASPES